MKQVLDFFGFPSEGKGATWGIVGIVSMGVIALDILNVADIVGIVKKQGNKFLPSIIKKDKFRKDTTTTTSQFMS